MKYLRVIQLMMIVVMMLWYVTGFIKTAPAWVKYVVASLASMLVGVGAGVIPDFPLTIESAATIGATSGATGQALFMHMPKTETPTS